MSLRRKVPDAETAQRWLSAAERSGLTRAAWCAVEGVDARSLQAWRLALARRAARYRSHAFVEVVARVPAADSGPPPLRVHVGEIVIEVVPGFHAASLTEVVRAIRAC